MDELEYLRQENRKLRALNLALAESLAAPQRTPLVVCSPRKNGIAISCTESVRFNLELQLHGPTKFTFNRILPSLELSGPSGTIRATAYREFIALTFVARGKWKYIDVPKNECSSLVSSLESLRSSLVDSPYNDPKSAGEIGFFLDELKAWIAR